MSDSDGASDNASITYSTAALRSFERDSVKHGQIGRARMRVVEYTLDWSEAVDWYSSDNESSDELEERRAEALRIEFPDSVWELIHITRLTIWRCPHPEIPSGIGNLTNLLVLIIDDCKITRIPDSIERLTALERLEINTCSKLLSLSPKMGGLKHLKDLRVDRTMIKCLPSELCKINKLEKISLWGNNEMKSLPTEIVYLEGLEKLYLDNNEQLIVPSEAFLIPSLKILRLQRCKDIKFPKEVQSPIEELEFSGMDLSSFLPDNFPTIMSNLKILKISDFPNPHLPPVFHNLTKIKTLTISSENISVFNTMPCLPNLKSMHLKIPDARMREARLSGDGLRSLGYYGYEYLPFKVFDDDAWKGNVSLEELTIYCVGSFNLAEYIFRGLPRTLRKLTLYPFYPKRIDVLLTAELPPGLKMLKLKGKDVSREEAIGCYRSLLERYVQLDDVRLHGTRYCDLPFYETYLWKFNQCGRVLMKDDEQSGIPLSLWPTVLARVDRVNRNVENRTWRGQLNASIIFQLLHSTAFLRRPGMGGIANTCASRGDDSKLQASTTRSLSDRKRNAEQMDTPR